jgi:glycosyltransferase involved in cell wall biosynthesis
MRIAWLIQELKHGGGHRVCLEISKVLADRGHEVVILLPRGRLLTDVPKPLKVIECGKSYDHPIKSILFNGPAMLRNLPQVDVIISTMPYMAFLNTIATWLRPVRGIHYVMADDYRLFDDRTLIRSPILLSLHKLSTMISYRLPLTILVNSTWTKNQVTGVGPTPKYILPNGVKADIFMPSHQRSASSTTFRLATVARKHAYKGWPDLVESLNLLWDERQDFELTAITQDPIITNGCRFPVTLVSPKDDQELVSYLQSADVFLFSSHREGFGLPPLEAMACGVPVVSTDLDGMREYAVHDANAWLVPVGSIQDMTNGIRHLLDNPELRSRLSAEGLKTSRQFTWQGIVDRLEQIMDESIGRR